MAKKYSVNPLAVLFHPEIDKINNYRTIVYDPTTEEILKINNFGHMILKTIDQNPDLDNNSIVKLTSENILKINRFLETMESKNIVFAK